MFKSGWLAFPIWNRGSWMRLFLLFILIGLGLAYMISMPGKSYQGVLPPLTEDEASLRNSLQRDVEKLAGEIGIRNVRQYGNLSAAADYLETSFVEAGYLVHLQGFEIDGKTVYNIEAEIKGLERPGEIIVVGAHYDTIEGSPGANDNATGAAAVLALARSFSGQKTSRTLRFVEFVNEEPPYYQTPQMGSWDYAKRLRERGGRVIAMLSLETIGYYSDKEGSQQYPFPFSLFYPSKGNFIAFVGNISSRSLVREVISSFREHTRFPSEGGALWGSIEGVGWSDHWAFWEEGYPAMMVTDTALFRYPGYHAVYDTPDKVQYDRLARVVSGLIKVVADLSKGPLDEN
jgi:hypothetical protein